MERKYNVALSQAHFIIINVSEKTKNKKTSSLCQGTTHSEVIICIVDKTNTKKEKI